MYSLPLFSTKMAELKFQVPAGVPWKAATTPGSAVTTDRCLAFTYLAALAKSATSYMYKPEIKEPLTFLKQPY